MSGKSSEESKIVDVMALSSIITKDDAVRASTVEYPPVYLEYARQIVAAVWREKANRAFGKDVAVAITGAEWTENVYEKTGDFSPTGRETRKTVKRGTSEQFRKALHDAAAQRSIRTSGAGGLKIGYVPHNAMRGSSPDKRAGSIIVGIIERDVKRAGKGKATVNAPTVNAPAPTA